MLINVIRGIDLVKTGMSCERWSAFMFFLRIWFCFLRSEARIVVVGSGADEIFGGYMRHRTTYLREGREAVLNELYEELQRIGERNLGRDDRVASSLGKSLRLDLFTIKMFCLAYFLTALLPFLVLFPSMQGFWSGPLSIQSNEFF